MAGPLSVHVGGLVAQIEQRVRPPFQSWRSYLNACACMSMDEHVKKLVVNAEADDEARHPGDSAECVGLGNSLAENYP
jgi:hypothetical protein